MISAQSNPRTHKKPKFKQIHESQIQNITQITWPHPNPLIPQNQTNPHTSNSQLHQ